MKWTRLKKNKKKQKEGIEKKKILRKIWPYNNRAL